ncbi:uracil-DNA glycosylase [Aeromicrobium phragmitis]|uniref:Type-4 uracil-DNA glycosylase n=1 Tax=Aeromicrobium phragmitis TaxID=2478914 RepID=A0A3L8PJU9_9ACTN|nr:UdgX family uracil-DNA binding protein [Aeromicrobium phragmitis]RLV55676.1 uracil-DNA glycosylase [Aeromicrobium phragmitis]
MSVERPGAEQWVPEDRDLDSIRAAAADCRGCELWADATQVVVSAGPPDATVMLVGEKPGDQEDREGEPFVGPAGRLLDEALEAAGIDRDRVYVTNAVKHFRFQERGNRRLHKKPAIAHIKACWPWLQAEMETVQPPVVVAMGATAGRAVLGRDVRIGEERGHVLSEDPAVLVTAHPSSVIRLRGRDGYDEAFQALVADLRAAAGQ